jgi:vacuolar-type H+-ATPase subunit C/Vma6
VANTMIIKNNNPDSFGNLTPGPVDMNRTPDMPFFSLLYKALLDGLKPSVGYDKKKEQSVNSTIKGVGMFIDTYNIIFKSKSEKNKKSKKDTKDAKAKQQPKE